MDYQANTTNRTAGVELLMISLEGTVERLTFISDDNTYIVARLKMPNGKLVTIVGNLPPLYIGEQLSVEGDWVSHKEYGLQFQVTEWQSKIPQTKKGIERFLASGLIKGVGPVTAKKIVNHFGLETLAIIENSPERLTEIAGIKLSKAEKIAKSLQEYSEVQKIMVFLQGIGIGPGLAFKIYQTFKEQSVKIVTENPYLLADRIMGIGFKTADQIAQKTGVSLDSPFRIKAGLKYLINESSNEGHIFITESELLKVATEELGVSELQVIAEIEDLIARKELFREDYEGTKIIYLAVFYYSEVGVVYRLKDLHEAGLKPVKVDAQALLDEFSQTIKIDLAPMQREAVYKALDNGVTVITGGPGTGKTTLIKTILHILKKAGLEVMLAAPTGRAAKRLSEATGAPAKTIHRLLGYGSEHANGSQFQFNEDEPLETDVLIIDEFSMVDLILFYNVLKAVTPGTRLILVGDVDQLPSVGPGSVLRDLLASQRIAAVRLDVIFRQAKESLIIENAHRINQGKLPILAKNKDFFFIKEENPEAIVAALPSLVRDRIPAFLNCDPIEDIQILAPMRRTITGVENLNLCLQAALNPVSDTKSEIVIGANIFRLGDKVMQLKNNYQKLVFNGDIGRIIDIDPEERKLVVAFQEAEGERAVEYESDELDQLTLSYAISVHKSQGNEYPVIIMPITTQHYLMLQRNLLYTAVTRAKKMVVLIGTAKAIGIAVRNNRIEKRNSLLCQRIQTQF